MGWWKADPSSEPRKTAGSTIETAPLASVQAQPTSDASSCPVDPKTRQIWLQQAQQGSKENKSQPLSPNHPQVNAQTRSVAPERFATTPSRECSSDRIDQTPTPSKPVLVPKYSRPLSYDREISTIPRAYPFTQTKDSSLPSNAESETGHDKASGNWIYPSESQFFNAVMRKHPESTSPADLASSISSIIPIHNAVNERAWKMIGKWEANEPSNKTCGGPRLLRFEGKGAGAKSPRAIMKSWSGYQEPFDRHDWTIQRCNGTEVEYVIDFYQGRSPAGQVSGSTQGAPASGMGGINFYLDVRPKLNSFEGCKMRFEKFVGWK